jgi:RimJ/RimL family protein N-acetyltransferase
MFEIYSNIHFAKVRELYVIEDRKFSFIYSILSGLQRGRVWVDSVTNIKAAFVCHDFGWSQLIGEVNNSFAENLIKYFFEDEQFSSFKLRIFSPKHSELFSRFCDVSERQQFYLKFTSNEYESPAIGSYKIETLTRANAGSSNEALRLDLFQRNWPSEEAFHRNSFGCIATLNGMPVSICYTCATMHGIQEIDVLTSKDHQGRGLAKAVSDKFIKMCWEKNLLPGWDCFTNNVGSMRLNQALGFIPVDSPYQFFTYNRKLPSKTVE